MQIPTAQIRSSLRRAGVAAVLAAMSARPVPAAERWSEVRTPHVTVWSAAGDRAASDMAWQLEQVRSVMGALWPWAGVDLARPLHVLVVKDEQAMRGLAPQYWERKGEMRPASVWVTGRDQHYMAIRTDVRNDDTATLNPHASSYFSYANLVITSSFDRPLPLWFARGLAGVISNTIVRDDQILLGPPIPWHLQTLREPRRIPLAQLLAMTRTSPEFTQGDGLRRVDAHAWALVHFLMFGDEGAHRAGLNRLAVALNAGKDPGAAFTEAVGRVEDIEARLLVYVQRSLFSYARVKVDANVRRERLSARPLSPAESAAGRAAFHVAMNRGIEARALIDEARKADPNAAGPFLAEALLLERDGKTDEAREAYAKAVELGSVSAWAHYRLATLGWSGAQPDPAALQAIERHLARAVELHPSFAAACAALAEARAALGQPEASILPLLKKAITIEPADPWHRLAAARVLWRLGALDEARRTAEHVKTLTDNEAARREADRLLTLMPR